MNTVVYVVNLHQKILVNNSKLQTFNNEKEVKNTVTVTNK